jgi:thiol-disulfide isomerase/thioredoxin
MKFGWFLILAAVATFTVPASAAAAPKLSINAFTQLPIVERTPYDVDLKAAAAVDAAFARARKNHKRVLIDLGGNWCPDCLVLANLMQLPEMKTFLAAHFEIVAVDVGRFDKNLDIPARFGITARLEGVPAVIVASPEGKILNRGKITALADARHMTPQSVADWLAGWTP